MGALSYVAQAKEWERQKEYRRAVECYLKMGELDTSSASDAQLLVQAYIKAGELIVKFLMDEGSANDELLQVANKLVELREYMAAGELFVLANMPEQAIEALINAGEWAKAKRIASEISSDTEKQVDERYREFLKNQGRLGELIDVDVVSAIDIMTERGQWETALNTAKQQNHRPLLDRYLIQYVTELFKTDQYVDAARLFIKYGTSSNPQNFNIYKLIIDRLLNSPNCGYEVVALLRDMVLDLNERIHSSNDTEFDARVIQVFERYQYVLHFYSLIKALSEMGGHEVDRLKMQLNVALVRYIELLQPDKVFYEAGNACKIFGGEYENMAFVFLNQYLDVVDAISENDPSIVDNSVFDGTDIPSNYSIPKQMFLGSEEHEEVKEWVLALSVGHDINKELKMDSRGCYEASTVDSEGSNYPVCVVSGYPVMPRDRHHLGSDKMANSVAWSTFTNLCKTESTDELFDVQQFILRWTGASSVY